MTDALRSRAEEAEDQCRLEHTKRIQLAALVGQFLRQAAPLVEDAGVPVELESPATPDGG